jgi:hypothetical protein
MNIIAAVREEFVHAASAERYVVEAEAVDSPERPLGWWPDVSIKVWKNEPGEGLHLVMHGLYPSPSLEDELYKETTVERTPVRCAVPLDEMKQWMDEPERKLGAKLREILPKELGVIAGWVGMCGGYVTAVRVQAWISS